MKSVTVPFVGPSYTLANRKADTQRTVNMYLRKVESGSGKAQYILKSVEGFTDETLTGTAPTGTFGGSVVIPENAAVSFSMVHAGTKLYKIASGVSTEYSSAAIGAASAGSTVFAVGREHVAITNASSGAAVYTIAPPAAASETFMNSRWIVYLAGRFIYQNASSDQFFWTDIDAPTTTDPLSFATAESAPDGIARGIKYREELWLFGGFSTEIWRPSDSPDAAFEKNQSVSISVGCAAPYSVVSADNSLFWIGQDESGSGVVYMAQGYTPRRISTHAVEEALLSSSDLFSSYAYSWQYEGHVFVCFQIPGLDTSWVYDTNTGSWHERAELVSGDYAQWKPQTHFYFEGKHYFGRDSALVYMDPTVYNWSGDTICRERTSPHYATPSLNTVFYSRLRLDCSVGTVVSGSKYVQLYYSNDGGYTYTASALQRSLGETGERRTMVQWNRLGSARDRVWKIKCTDDVLFDIVNVDVQAEEGTA